MKRFMRPWYVTPRQATAMSAPSSWTTSGPLRLCRRSNPDQLRQFLQQLHVLDQEIAHDFADIPALLQRDALQTLLQLAVKVDRQTYARFLPAKLAETPHLDIADPEAGARLEGFQPLRRLRAPVDRRRREQRHTDHGAHILIARQHGESRHVIRVFVGDQDGVDILQRFANGGEALAQFAHTQAGIHQDSRIFGGQEGGVAGTAAGQHAEFYRCLLPESSEYTR